MNVPLLDFHFTELSSCLQKARRRLQNFEQLLNLTPLEALHLKVVPTKTHTNLLLPSKFLISDTGLNSVEKFPKPFISWTL